MCFVRSLKQQGAEEAHRALPNEALYGNLRMLGLIIPAYLHTAWQPGQAKNLASRVSSHCSVLINLQVTWVKSLSTSRSSPESMSGGVNLYSVCVCACAREFVSEFSWEEGNDASCEQGTSTERGQPCTSSQRCSPCALVTAN